MSGVSTKLTNAGSAETERRRAGGLLYLLETLEPLAFVRRFPPPNWCSYLRIAVRSARRLHFRYECFLENQLRDKFEFIGTPIRFLQRVKERRRG